MSTEEFSFIGKPLAKVDAWEKVVGAARYADDFFLPRMAYAKIRRSDHPHALIKRVDTTRAQALPGVYAVVTGRDFPAVKFGILPVSQDEEALCTDKVRMVGDPIAAVAAVDEETAERAADLIDVEYEVLPPIMSVEEALAQDKVRIHEYGDGPNIHKAVAFEFGDVEEGFRQADLVREDVFFYQGNTHLPMEQHAAVAQWSPDGKLTLWSSTQTPHYVHRALAKTLQMPPAHIRVIAAPVGGGFGGKTDPFSHEIVVARLAQLTGRPVKIGLTREEVFYCHRGRHPVLMWIKTGVTKNGEILAMHCRSYVDGGAYGSYGVASLLYTGALQTVTYKVPRYKFEGVRAFTNKPPCGPKRGHGTPQPRYALECHLDKIAEQLGLDPAEMRRRIAVDEYTKTANHLTVTTCGLRECIDRVVEASGWREKHRKLPYGKGVGFACSSYLTGAGLPIYWNDMPHSGAIVKVDRGGGVAILCGATEIGQGSDSVLTYVVAEQLGIDPKDIRVATADSDLTPVDLGSYSSRVTLMAGHAAAQAAGRIRTLLHEAVAKKLEVAPAELVSRGGRVFVKDDPERGVSFAEAAVLGETMHGPLALLFLHGLCGGGQRGPGHRRGEGGPGVDRPRRGARPEPAPGGRAGRGLGVHGARRGPDGRAGVPGGAPQDSLHARVQEPDHARDARDLHDPRRDGGSGGPLRRQGGGARAAPAGPPRGGERRARRRRGAHRRGSHLTREGREGPRAETAGQAGARGARAAPRLQVSRAGQGCVRLRRGRRSVCQEEDSGMMRLPPLTYLAP